MRVLAVEDEDRLLGILLRTLKAEGFSVDGVTTAHEALEQIKLNHYDLIILDLQLPDGSGTTLLRQIRQQQRKMPVLILTARGDIDSKIENFEAGADDYLTKPFALAELMIRVHALLRRGPLIQDNILKVENLELNRLTRQVRRGGKRIELSPKGIFAAGISFPSCRAHAVALHDRRTHLGSVLRGAHQYRRCLYRPSAPQDRRRVRAQTDSHGARPRLFSRSASK